MKTAPPETPNPVNDPSESAESWAIKLTPDQRFQFYLQERQSVVEGARASYERFDQTIVGLSGGSIVLSITFLKDIGRGVEYLPWLFLAWGLFLLASLCAFISLLTSGAQGHAKIEELDCLIQTGDCDESEAKRLTRITARLNRSALILCIGGVVAMLVFGTNILLTGGTKWQNQPKASAVVPGDEPARKAPRKPEKSTTQVAPTPVPRSPVP